MIVANPHANTIIRSARSALERHGVSVQAHARAIKESPYPADPGLEYFWWSTLQAAGVPVQLACDTTRDAMRANRSASHARYVARLAS